MLCPSCGSELNRPDQKYCQYCGMELTGITNTSMNEQSPPISPKTVPIMPRNRSEYHPPSLSSHSTSQNESIQSPDTHIYSYPDQALISEDHPNSKNIICLILSLVSCSLGLFPFILVGLIYTTSGFPQNILGLIVVISLSHIGGLTTGIISIVVIRRSTNIYAKKNSIKTVGKVFAIIGIVINAIGIYILIQLSSFLIGSVISAYRSRNLY